MRAENVQVQESKGRILYTTIFRSGGKKLLAKGHLITEEDVRLLESEGLNEIWVSELEAGDIGEDDAVMQVGVAVGCGSLEIRLAAGGRSNLVATEDCCVLVDEELLKKINCTSSIVVATSTNFSFAPAGARIATVKSTPFAVPEDQLQVVKGILGERGPILQARPVRKPAVGVLYSDPWNGERARQLLESVVRQRLERYGTSPRYSLSVVEEPAQVTKALQHLLRSKPTVVLIASTTAPAGPEDVVGQAMLAAGCTMERFLAPVEPGNLLLLGYKDEIPIVSAPGCHRSAKENIIDLILPPMLANYRVSGWEIACLGHGGLMG
jgi:molybdenum cofactor cytidylyltransferase